MVGTCTKCKETHPLQRHHRGCEAMWLRHFVGREKTKLYKAFADRYYSFNERDIVRLCENCHQLIHTIYLHQINLMVAEGGYRKLSQWDWEEARKMMKTLRKVCKLWLEGRL